MIYSEMMAVEEGAFNGLSLVEKLYLHDNRLMGLNAGDLRGLTSLSFLSLSDNNIAIIHLGTFDDTPKLEFLFLDNNLFISLQQNVFAGLSALRQLTIVATNFHPPEKLFKTVPGLKKLHLEGNGLKLGGFWTENTLPPELFQDLENLEYLDLSDNFINSMPDFFFKDLVRLEQLNLGQNNLRSLPEDIFRNTKALTHINLQYNEFDEIESNTFSSLQNLKELILNGNRLKTLSESIFSAQPGHLILWIADNPLRCGSDMCWMKRGEAEGWLEFGVQKNIEHGPECVNYKNKLWGSIDLECDKGKRQ